MAARSKFKTENSHLLMLYVEFLLVFGHWTQDCDDEEVSIPVFFFLTAHQVVPKASKQPFVLSYKF